MTKQTTLDEEDVAESWPDPVGRNVCRYEADEARRTGDWPSDEFEVQVERRGSEARVAKA